MINFFYLKRIGPSLFLSDTQKSNEIMDIDVPEKIGRSQYLVEYFGALHANAYYWVLTELMDCSLDDFFKKAHQNVHIMPEMLLSKVAYIILNALKFMRSKDIIHRDIKAYFLSINRKYYV